MQAPTLTDTLAELQTQEDAELAKAKNATARKKKIHAKYRTLHKKARRNARMGKTRHSITFDAEAQAKREYDEVTARNKGTDQWMKAPNSKPTHLAERQRVQVRTPSFKAWFGDWEKAAEIKNTVDFLLNGQNVTTLVGNEFEPNGQKLSDRVPEFFNAKYGGFATSPVFGKVLLDKEGVADDIAHGLGRLKACAFAAVHDVIERGVVYNKSDNWKGRGWKTAVIGAPIKIGQEDYICEVIIKTLPYRQGFYLHEVELKNKLEVAFKTPTKGSASSSSHLIISQLLDDVPRSATKTANRWCIVVRRMTRLHKTQERVSSHLSVTLRRTNSTQSGMKKAMV